METLTCYVQLDLRTPSGVQEGEALLPFESFEAACCDVYAAIPAMAADMLRAGVDPMACSYLVRSEDGRTMTEIFFSELVRRDALPPAPARLPDESWQQTNARLRQRSEEAIGRFDRASSWMRRSIGEALAVERRAEDRVARSDGGRARVGAHPVT